MAARFPPGKAVLISRALHWDIQVIKIIWSPLPLPTLFPIPHDPYSTQHGQSDVPGYSTVTSYYYPTLFPTPHDELYSTQHGQSDVPGYSVTSYCYPLFPPHPMAYSTQHDQSDVPGYSSCYQLLLPTLFPTPHDELYSTQHDQ